MNIYHTASNLAILFSSNNVMMKPCGLSAPKSCCIQSVSKLLVSPATRTTKVSFGGVDLIAGPTLLNRRLAEVTSDALINERPSLAPFWTDATLRISKDSWMPTESSSHEIKRPTASDQFTECLKLYRATPVSENARKISWQSSASNVVPEEKSKTIKAAKIRIRPTPKQAEMMRKCIGAHRFFWNAAKAFSDPIRNQAYTERKDYLETTKDLGCAKCPAGTACGKPCVQGTMGCEDHPSAQGCVSQKVHDSKIDCMFASCKKKAIEGTYGCKSHPGTEGCVPWQPMKCVVCKPSKDRCGRPVDDPEAYIGSANRYYCSRHCGGGIESKPSHNGFSLSSWLTIRDAVVHNEKDLLPEQAWQKEIPFDTRSGAVKKYCSNVDAFFALQKTNKDAQMPGFLKKKDKKDSIFVVDEGAIGYRNGRIFLFTKKKLGDIKMSPKACQETLQP